MYSSRFHPAFLFSPSPSRPSCLSLFSILFLFLILFSGAKGTGEKKSAEFSLDTLCCSVFLYCLFFMMRILGVQRVYFRCNSTTITFQPELRSILKLCCASMDFGYYQYPFTQLLRNQFFIYLSASLLIRTQFLVYAIPVSRKFPTLATSLCRKSSSTCVYDTVVE